MMCVMKFNEMMSLKFVFRWLVLPHEGGPRDGREWSERPNVVKEEAENASARILFGMRQARMELAANPLRWWLKGCFGGTMKWLVSVSLRDE